MKHYGDITKISGAAVPPVNIITGGSPCQDLSVAGKRAGLAGERSGLFMEQIRIIREMREQQNRVAEYRDDIARAGGTDTEKYHRADASLLVYIDARLILDKIPTIIEAEQNEEEVKQ